VGIASLDDEHDYAFHRSNQSTYDDDDEEVDMSRSNPSDHLQNPAQRWLEWNGEQGSLRYYDKEAKQNVAVPLPFSFLLLDEVATVRGWHDASNSGIVSNEVRDTSTEILVVRAFKGGTIAEGKYRDIKTPVNAAGGGYVASCYIAYKDGKDYKLGNLQLKGAALGAWMDFRKLHRASLYSKAIRIDDYAEGKKGRVVFRVPIFTLNDVSADADARAKALDAELQAFLDVYMKRNKRDQADASQPTHLSDEEVAQMPTVTADEIPFAWLLPLLLPLLALGGLA
jgi:hypothetical protein